MGPRTGDAFGALLLACHAAGGRPGAVLEVVERDDGHVRVNDAARWFTVGGPVLDDWVLDRARGDVLDVGAGAGRHALLLQERGLRVVALDPSPGAAEVCRRRGVRDVVVGTVQDAPPARSDTLLLLGNNVGLLGGRAQAPELLAGLAACARPGARLLGTGTGREPGAGSDPDDDAYEQRNLARGRFPWQVTMRSRYGALATPWFDYAFLRLEELEELLSGSPWALSDAWSEGPSYAVELVLLP